ncbi:uncharacterized protein L3040_008217 [Drepanopeziza brunnea f. sp. 'multigermtubi']|uniref:uncharacterized protein n=1 Tax=Drepanopeziza brunnea f. sp. 'multigermtubi' TaxID=698441 RepID=UPI00238BAF3A|nr:hypothetical protein L3040_008217 [Drepanopeziza brunnea f. sp. 'multigermtubi']
MLPKLRILNLLYNDFNDMPQMNFKGSCYASYINIPTSEGRHRSKPSIHKHIYHIHNLSQLSHSCGAGACDS